MILYHPFYFIKLLNLKNYMARKKKDEEDELVEAQTDDLSKIMEGIDAVKKLYKGTDAGDINLMSDMYEKLMPSGYITTGDWILDLIISNRPHGGLPLSKFINIFGDSSVGKSLIVAVIMAAFQKAGGYAMYFDTERAVFPPFMEVLGVDPKKTIFIGKMRTLEKIFETIVTVVINNKKRKVDVPFVIVIDSMTATNIESVIEDLTAFGDSGFQGGAKKQKVLGEAFQKIIDFIKDEKVCFITTDQIRDNMERANKFSAKTRSTSGNAQRFYSDVRLELTLKTNIKNANKEFIGTEINVKTVKNRIAPNKRETTIFLYGTKGLDKYKSFLEHLKKQNIISSTSAGIKYTLEDGEVFRIDGKMPSESQFKKLLRTDSEFFDILYNKLYPNYIVKYDRKGDDYFDDLDEDLIYENPEDEESEID